MLAGMEANIEAGLGRGFLDRNNAGVPMEYTLVRHSARFDFFRMSPVPSGREYNVFGSEQGLPVQLIARLPCQGFAPFDFLERTWKKPADHDLELTAVYGDWTLDTKWSYLDAGGVPEREEWTGG